MSRASIAFWLNVSARLFVMVLCAAAIAFTGWHVGWNHLFETAFGTTNGMVIGLMCVTGFVSWLYLAADTFIWLQHDIKTLWHVRRVAQERAAARKRLELLMQNDISPRNAETLLIRINKVK